MAFRYSADEDLKTFHARIKGSSKDRLDTACRALGISMNHGLNEAVDAWVDSPAVASAISATYVQNFRSVAGTTPEVVTTSSANLAAFRYVDGDALVRRLSGVADDSTPNTPGGDDDQDL